MSTLIQQIATKKSLVESIAKANKEAQAKSSLAMMDAAVLRQKEIANASGSYSYSGSSYGSFVDENLLALEAATLVNSDKKQSTSYSYSGSSYGGGSFSRGASGTTRNTQNSKPTTIPTKLR